MFKNPNRNCILMSPGRTGSLLITTFLSHVTHIFPIIRNHYDNKKLMMPKQILHSHDPVDVNLANENTIFILSTRNMIECAYSRIIGYRNQQYRYYGDKNNYTIKSFRIENYDFERAYQYAVKYYTDLKPYLPNNHLRIDYKQFADDPTKLLNIFDIPEKTYKFFTDRYLIPIKTPGSYSDYIINFDEINEYAKTFDPNPPI